MAPNPEKFWDCKSCGATQLPATIDHGCPKCGAVRPRQRLNKGILLVAALALPSCFLLLGVLWTKDVQIEVTGHRWERTVVTEEFQAVNGGNWCTEVPSIAYEISRSTGQREATSVDGGDDCFTVKVANSDGTFSLEKICSPVSSAQPGDAEWCDYNLDTWVVVDTAKTSGLGLAGRPELDEPAASNCAALGCTRRAVIESSYWIDLEDDEDETHACLYDPEVWGGFEVGSTWPAKKRILTGGLSCRSILRTIEHPGET